MKQAVNSIAESLAVWTEDAGVPAAFNPFRAIALARTVAGIPAATIAAQMRISRTYLAGLENYSRPPILSTLPYLENLLESSEEFQGAEAFWDTFTLLTGLKRRDHCLPVLEYHAFLHERLSDLEPRVSLLLLEAAAQLTGQFDVLYHNIPDDLFFFIAPSGILPSFWPLQKIPRTIITKPQSLLAAFAVGLMSAEEVVRYLKDVNEKGIYARLSPMLFLDRLNRYPTRFNLFAGCAFFFDKIEILISRNAYPLDINVFFKGEKIRFRDVIKGDNVGRSIILGMTAEELLQEFPCLAKEETRARIEGRGDHRADRPGRERTDANSLKAGT